MELKIREVHEHTVSLDGLAMDFVYEDLDDYINKPTLKDIEDYLEFWLKHFYYDRKTGRGIDYNHLLPQDKEKLLRKFIDIVNDLLSVEGKDELDINV